MSDGGARRVVIAGVGYLLVASLVLLVAGWVRPVLALPALFPRMLRTVLVVGLPITLVLAWRYPRLGHHGALHPRGSAHAEQVTRLGEVSHPEEEEPHR